MLFYYINFSKIIFHDDLHGKDITSY